MRDGSHTAAILLLYCVFCACSVPLPPTSVTVALLESADAGVVASARMRVAWSSTPPRNSSWFVRILPLHFATAFVDAGGVQEAEFSLLLVPGLSYSVQVAATDGDSYSPWVTGGENLTVPSTTVSALEDALRRDGVSSPAQSHDQYASVRMASSGAPERDAFGRSLESFLQSPGLAARTEVLDSGSHQVLFALRNLPSTGVAQAAAVIVRQLRAVMEQLHANGVREVDWGDGVSVWTNSTLLLVKCGESYGAAQCASAGVNAAIIYYYILGALSALLIICWAVTRWMGSPVSLVSSGRAVLLTIAAFADFVTDVSNTHAVYSERHDETWLWALGGSCLVVSMAVGAWSSVVVFRKLKAARSDRRTKAQKLSAWMNANMGVLGVVSVACVLGGVNILGLLTTGLFRFSGLTIQKAGVSVEELEYYIRNQGIYGWLAEDAVQLVLQVYLIATYKQSDAMTITTVALIFSVLSTVAYVARWVLTKVAGPEGLETKPQATIRMNQIIAAPTAEVPAPSRKIELTGSASVGIGYGFGIGGYATLVRPQSHPDLTESVANMPHENPAPPNTEDETGHNAQRGR